MTHFKILLAALLVVYVQANEEMKAMGKVLHDSCVEEVGTPEALISDAAKGNFANDQKLKCYMKCLFTSVSIMDDEGVIDLDIMRSMLPPTHMELGLKIIEACKHLVDTYKEACELSYQVHLCMHKFSPEDYFLI